MSYRKILIFFYDRFPRFIKYKSIGINIDSMKYIIL